MGNYCCTEDKQDLPKVKVLKKKSTLKDPSVRKKYQEDLSSILNTALTKYSQVKSVVQLSIKGQLGKGGQGSVFLVELLEVDRQGTASKQNYAMKRVSKQKLDIERTRQALLLEKEILISNQSNFLTQIQYAFQDNSYLYYLMDIAQGGDLFSLMRNQNNFNTQKAILYQQKGQQAVSFLLAGVILGLEYLHDKDIIYRDLKPENILLFTDGYPKLADFGIAKKFKNNQLCYDIKGTIIYFSPEMVSKKGYDRSIDLWALGILTYELLFNEPPFTSAQINSKNFISKCQEWEKKPIFTRQVDKVGKDFIKSLLRVQPQQRLGYYDFGEIKRHPLFDNIDWEAYENKKLESPIQEIIESYPISQQISPQINETLEIEERDYLPFTFVKNSKGGFSSCQSLDTLTQLHQNQTHQ